MMNGKIIKEAITFDDVLLVPGRSEVLPHEVSLKTRLTKNITLNVPILSAAMDTVTEGDLAIALARQGGIGFIHKNMSIADQAAEVDRVKRNESGMIKNPVTLKKDSRLGDAEDIMRRYKISGLPVVEENGKLIGIITNRDLKYRKNLDESVSDIMTKEKLVTAPVGTTLEEAKDILLFNRIEKLPIVDEEGYLKGLITIKDIDNLVEYPNACKDSQGRLRVGGAVGAGADTLERVAALVKAGVDIITVDSAHGHSLGIINIIKAIREKFPNIDLIGGNIVTAEAAADLIDAGVNAVKVGVGPGSI
ncbi:MAG: IMP dehydrogenase, partial [Fusobacteriaceae bacterium]